MKIKGSLLQIILVLVQVIFLISAIGIDTYMNVKKAYSDDLASLSRGLLYTTIIMGCVIPLLQKDDDEKKEEKSEEKKDEEK